MQIRQCWKFGQNSSLATCTSIILWNCYQPLSIISFCCIALPFEANWTMLKIWSEFIFSHFNSVPQLYFESITNHSAYFCSTAFCFLLWQIRQCWKFGQNSSSATHTSIIVWNYYQPLSVLSFPCISHHFEANWTLLKIWSDFIFGRSYLHYSLKLLPTSQHTFIPLHFASFWGKSDNVENLVRIHLWPLVPPLIFETATNHSAYFCSNQSENLLRIHIQPLEPPLFFKTVANHSAYLHSAAFCFISSHYYLFLCYSSKLWPTTKHTLIQQHFAPFQGKSDNAENFFGIHVEPLLPVLLWPTTQHTFIPLHFISFWGKLDNAENLLRIHV